MVLYIVALLNFCDHDKIIFLGKFKIFYFLSQLVELQANVPGSYLKHGTHWEKFPIQLSILNEKKLSAPLKCKVMQSYCSNLPCWSPSQITPISTLRHSKVLKKKYFAFNIWCWKKNKFTIKMLLVQIFHPIPFVNRFENNCRFDCIRELNECSEIEFSTPVWPALFRENSKKRKPPL